MPKEYKACVKSLKSEGKSHKDAQRICAISYYKKHGKRPQDDEKASLSGYENALFNIIEILNATISSN